jgi:regulator of cell morphogenesis and NO signaling
MNADIDTPEQTLAPDRADQALGQIAVQLPGATAVFRRLKLDFCCGGQVSLRQAAQDKGLNLDGVVEELSRLDRSDEAPATVAPAPLIDHILSRYHEVHRAQLPELIRMARRVEAMEAELQDHMQKEETILFPLLKAGGNPFVVHPIGVMRAEHTSHGETLEQLAALTHDATPPIGACNTWRALYAGIAQLTDDLINHIHLENNVLFPQFEPRKAETGCGSACSCQ